MTVLQSSIAAASGAAAPTGYQIERSLRLNSADSAYLSWIPPQSGNRRTWTWSGWIKKSMLSSTYGDRAVIFGGYGAMSNTEWIEFGFGNSGDTGGFDCIYSTTSGSSTGTTSLYRDTSSWYHVVIALDTTQATQANRLKIYINGVLTNFASASFGAIATQNVELGVNGAWAHAIGKSPYSAVARNVNGYFAEVNFIDGQQLDPTSFGEFNSATGVWSPLAYTGTYGNNGFYLPFNDNSTALNLGRNRQTLTADPYFPVTTLLLNGNGTNGAQNNTFLDSSTNNFTITRNGNTTQGTFSPFSQTGWSTFFNGSQTTPSLSFPSNAAYSLGSTADFTVEMSVYFTNGIGSEVSLIERFDGTSGPGWIFGKSSGDKFWVGFGGSTYPCNTSLVANRWYHLCWMRTGGNSYLFVDGVLDRAAVTTANFTDGSSPLSLGERDGIQTFPLTGYMSNVRIVKGTAVYNTAGFTVPTAALTAVTNTSLLTCQSNRFVDNSTTAATATVGAASSIQAFSPFTPTAAYDTAVVGGSGYFDGSGDYLTVPDNAVYDLSGDFTLELWAYMNDFASSGAAPSFISGTNSSNNWLFFVTASNEVIFMFNTGIVINGTATSTVKEWAHYALCRSGSTLRVFKNGVLLTSVTNSTNFTISNSVLYLGVQNGSNGFINGYMSGLRLVNGTALYTAAFTPPTAPPTAITNTALLLNFTNAGIIDATGKNVLETVGNAQISTTQSKWGGSSIYIPGTAGSYVFSPSSQSYNLFGADMTIEGWLYPTSGSLGTRSEHVLAFVVDGSNRVSLYFNGTTFTFWTSTTGGGSGARITSTAISVNTQSHFALVKQGSTFTLYVNGVSQGTSTTTVYPTAAMSLRIGTYDGAVANDTYTGYIDDLRISKFARYTGNFTVPQAQFAYNQADINVKQWVPTNLSITAGVGNDSLVDTPTNYGTDTGAGGEVRGNYPTWNPLLGPTPLGGTFTDGNLFGSVVNGDHAHTNMATPTTGKWYWEFTIGSSALGNGVGIALTTSRLRDTSSYYYGAKSTGTTGNLYTNGATSTYGANYTTNDVIGVALNLDAGTLTFYKNGVSQGVAASSVSGNFDATIAGGGAQTMSAYINFGQRPFAYAAPSGFKALCSTNLPTPAIGATSSTLASKNMNIITWTGTGSGTSRALTGVGFLPDLVWSKNRTGAFAHTLHDAVRGAGSLKALYSSSTIAESGGDTNANGYLSSFDSDGFTFTNGSSGTTPAAYFNTSGSGYVGWAWNAGGATVTNTNGSISSQVRANPAAGISVVSWTSNAAAAIETMGHGLGVTPSFVIIKNRDLSDWWLVYHKSFSNTVRNYLQLNTTGGVATASADYWGHTSTLLGVRQTAMATASGQRCIAYCFAEVPGFSKFGSYTGNGSTNGPFVYCGFRPKFILVKNTDTGTEVWGMLDSARDTYNVANKRLYPNASNAENTGDPIVVDFLSNGFKLRSTDAMSNASRAYIFAAFAEAPFNYARAR